jgi:hypothetical protein
MSSLKSLELAYGDRRGNFVVLAQQSFGEIEKLVRAAFRIDTKNPLPMCFVAADVAIRSTEELFASSESSYTVDFRRESVHQNLLEVPPHFFLAFAISHVRLLDCFFGCAAGSILGA